MIPGLRMTTSFGPESMFSLGFIRVLGYSGVDVGVIPGSWKPLFGVSGPRDCFIKKPGEGFPKKAFSGKISSPALGIPVRV